MDIAWVGFAGLSLAAMRLLPTWQTVPFLAIWVSLTAIYAFRLWRLPPTMLTLAALTLTTGGIIGVQVLRGQHDAYAPSSHRKLLRSSRHAMPSLA